jgi:hypothetical protein
LSHLCDSLPLCSGLSMKARSECHHALDQWLQQIGVPRVIIPDGAGEFTGPESQFVKKSRKVQCLIHPIEAYSPNQSIAGDVIRELKRMFRRTMLATRAPRQVWDWCIDAIIRTAVGWRSIRACASETGWVTWWELRYELS